MTTWPEVVEELRALFKDGATPSRLIRHIAERHAGEASLHLLVQLYFTEAFGVSLVRGVNPTERHEDHDLRYAFLNEQLLHEMVQCAPQWDGGDQGTWLEGLTATDPAAWLRSAPADPPADLRRCWNSLTPAERQYIQMIQASAGGLSETVEILSRLCERLQQQVNELSAAPAAR